MNLPSQEPSDVGEVITLNLTDDQMLQMVNTYAISHFDPCAYQQFQNILNETGSLEQALLVGVINQQTLTALNLIIQKQETPSDDAPT